LPFYSKPIHRAAVEIQLKTGENKTNSHTNLLRNKEIILGLDYVSYNDVEIIPPGELDRLVVGCRVEGTHLIIVCEANSHHNFWGSTNINRIEPLFNYIMANGWDIMNRGNRPTFVTSNKQEFIDITIATFYAGNFIKDWYVPEEVSCSDHRYIGFTVMSTDHSV